MLNRIRPKPSASGATMAAHTGAVMISHTAAVGRISSTRRRVKRGRVCGNVNSLQSVSKLADSQSGLVRRVRPWCNGEATVRFWYSFAGLAGSSSAWQSTTFGTWGPEVQILSPRLKAARDYTDE